MQSLGGGLAIHDPVCVDQRVIECRADVLVYSTPVLTEPIAIVGDVSAELYVSADVEDADVFVKLVDVYPDGTAYNLADSCLRLRYRDGFEQPAKLVPGQIHRVRIGGITTANYFPAGRDRIRIEIAGSSFPLADRNWHAGDCNDLATDGPIAHLTLHHGQGLRVGAALPRLHRPDHDQHADVRHPVGQPAVTGPVGVLPSLVDQQTRIGRSRCVSDRAFGFPCTDERGRRGPVSGFRDYQSVIQAGVCRDDATRRVPLDPEEVRALFGRMVGRAWTPAEIDILDHAASSAML